MRKCYLDANVIISFTSLVYPKFSAARTLLVKLMQHGVAPAISPLCIDELLHTVQKNHHVRKQNEKHLLAKKALDQVLSIPDLKILNPPDSKAAQKKIISLIEKYNLGSRDSYQLLTAQYNKAEFFETFDKDFEKVYKAKELKRFKP